MHPVHDSLSTVTEQGMNTLKLLVYLTPVQTLSGPLHYVRGSNRWHRSLEDMAARKTCRFFDDCFRMDPCAREVFACLHPSMQHKHTFCLDQPATSDMLASLRCQTTTYDAMRCKRGLLNIVCVCNVVLW